MVVRPSVLALFLLCCVFGNPLAFFTAPRHNVPSSDDGAPKKSKAITVEVKFVIVNGPGKEETAEKHWSVAWLKSFESRKKTKNIHICVYILSLPVKD